MLKSVALYVLLVGLPLCGLFAILDWGQSLEPPRAVAGDWRLTSDEPASCDPLGAGAVLRVEQSGRFLRVRLDDGPAHPAGLDGQSVRTRVRVRAGDCSGHEATIHAVLSDDDQALVGSVEAHGCRACPMSEIVARRDGPTH